MRYLTFSAVLAICGMGALAAPQDAEAKGPPKPAGAPSSGKGPVGPPAGGGKGPGGKTGGAGGIPSGLFESLAQYQPLLNSVLGQPAKPPSGCSKYEVMFARGTLEPGPYGFIVGDPLLAQIKQKLPGARGYNVQYPADFSADSATKGISDVIQRLNSQTKACPDEKFALVGYSQGAAIMHGVAGKLDSEVSKKVLAIVLYGDMTRTMGKWPAALQSKIYENCAKGDMCGEGTQGNGHLSYRDGTFHKDGSDFIAAAYNGKPMAAHL